MSWQRDTPCLGLRRLSGGLVVALGFILSTGSAFPHPLAGQLPAPPVAAQSPFEWGGYASLVIGQPERPEAIEQDNVREFAAALLAWGQLTQRASYFAEFDVATRTSNTWTGRETDESLSPVRIYLEYAHSERLRLRAGRFLTPIGQWNEAHAEPLTWTPTRPLTSYRAFSKSLTGVLAAGTGSLGNHDWGYALYWAPALGLDAGLDEMEETSVLSAIGGRVGLELGRGVTLGLSASRARRARPTLDPVAAPPPTLAANEASARPILGADFRWYRRDLRVLAESIWVPTGDGGRSAEGGGFVLGSVRLAGSLWGVTKTEVYRPADARRVTVQYVGATFRSSARIVIKAGYQFSQHPSRRLPSGWFVSFSSLF